MNHSSSGDTPSLVNQQSETTTVDTEVEASIMNSGRERSAQAQTFRLNAQFEEFYRRIIPPFQWEGFFEYLMRDLPLTFRHSNVLSVQAYIEPHFYEFLNNSDPSDVDLTKEIKVVPWSRGKIFQFDEVSRSDLKKKDAYVKFHQFLVHSTEMGFLMRQELVSMLPPILLNVKPWHTVLDMCAAPGSKTAQLLEYLNYDLYGADFEPYRPVPDDRCTHLLNTRSERRNAPQDSVFVGSYRQRGFLIANDSNRNRCFTLIHQMKRLPYNNYIVTMHDASQFPNLLVPQNENTTSSDDAAFDSSFYQFLKFDRVLCDVPCTGDGTFRKSPSVNKYWHIKKAYGMHDLQVRILYRGLQLLKSFPKLNAIQVGSTPLLVYSTCSMNPIENELVVLSVLQKYEGEVAVIDPTSFLPQDLNYVKGITDSVLLNSLIVGKKLRHLKQRSFTDEELVKKYNLQHCIRIYPHIFNSGGFFMALFTKYTHSVKADACLDEEKLEKTEEKVENEASVERKRKVNVQDAAISLTDFMQEITLENVPSAKQIFKTMTEFYGIDMHSVQEEKGLYPFYRIVQSDRKKNDEESFSKVFLMNRNLLDICVKNQCRLRVFFGGERSIEKKSLKENIRTMYRVVQGAMDFLYFRRSADVKIMMTAVVTERSDFEKLLANEDVQKGELSKELNAQCVKLPIGYMVVEVQVEGKYPSPVYYKFLCGFNGVNRVRMFVNKQLKSHLLYAVLGVELGLAYSTVDEGTRKKE